MRHTQAARPARGSLAVIRWKGGNISEERKGALSGFPIPAFFVAALDTTAGLLTHLFNEERSLTGRTGLGDRAVPQRILALRITTTGIEGAALLRPLLNQVTIATWLRAFHTQSERLRCFAFRISGAGDELSEAPRFHNHGTAALITFFVGG